MDIRYSFLDNLFRDGIRGHPFPPGRFFAFSGGTLAALGSLDVKWLMILLAVAAIGGDTVNYWIGYTSGPKVFKREKSRFFNKEYLRRTHQFYEKYGGKTIIIARFIPIIRTFAPFVAGIGSMTYGRFITYNIAGGIAWVVILVLGGYFFGNIPLIKHNFSLVIVAIIFLSILPGIIEFLRHRKGL